MGSNWRFNVWDVGWSNSQIRLVARLQTPLPPFTHIAKDMTFGTPRGVLGAADATGWIPTWFVYILNPTLPFPYGVAVDPD